jgi:hypothetical protein
MLFLVAGVFCVFLVAGAFCDFVSFANLDYVNEILLFTED